MVMCFTSDLMYKYCSLSLRLRVNAAGSNPEERYKRLRFLDCHALFYKARNDEDEIETMQQTINN